MHSIISAPPVLAVNTITEVFKSSDSILQAICVLLLLSSFAVWAVIFDKAFSLSCTYAKNCRFLKLVSTLKNDPTELKAQAESSDSPAAAVYLAACRCMESSSPAQPGEKNLVRSIGIIHAGSAMRRAIDRQLFRMKKRLLFLRTAIVGIPLLGVTGLVWGILIAFEKYAQTGCESIQPLAAGIPTALLPLVIALLAVVPTLTGFRLVTSRIEDVRIQLDILAEEIRAVMESGLNLAPEWSYMVRNPEPAMDLFVQEFLSILTKHWNRSEKD